MFSFSKLFYFLGPRIMCLCIGLLFDAIHQSSNNNQNKEKRPIVHYTWKRTWDLVDRIRTQWGRWILDYFPRFCLHLKFTRTLLSPVQQIPVSRHSVSFNPAQLNFLIFFLVWLVGIMFGFLCCTVHVRHPMKEVEFGRAWSLWFCCGIRYNGKY